LSTYAESEERALENPRNWIVLQPKYLSNASSTLFIFLTVNTPGMLITK